MQVARSINELWQLSKTLNDLITTWSALEKGGNGIFMLTLYA